jgi:Uma2 family endonuclease
MTPALTPLAEYLATSYRPDCDYVDGAVLERNWGDYDHARLQSALTRAFWTREREWNIRVVVEQRIQVRATCFRVPDVTVLDRAQPIEQIFTRPPLAVMEVLSPEDTWRRIAQKTTDYLDFAIRHVWILDPAPRKAWAATRGGFEETRILQVAGSPILISLDELFEVAE